MIVRRAGPLLAAACLLLAAAGGRTPAASAPPPAATADADAEAARVALGRRLFYDGDLSLDGSMSCATCHVQRRGFADSTRTRPGVTDEPGRRNVPGLANVGRRRSLTWGDASIRTLEAQALVPILGEHPVEMGMKGREAELAGRLGRSACYARLFRAAFPAEAGRIDMDTVAGALAAFQRGLVSADAPADRFDRGDASALSPEAREGSRLFARRCADCHAGPDRTDDRFHRVAAGAVDPRDRGLGEITGRARDDGHFRTPSLRNVAVSAPYFHDGESPTLEHAIRRHRQVRLRDGEMAPLLAWLGALTDDRFLADPRFAYPDGPCEA